MAAALGSGGGGGGWDRVRPPALLALGAAAACGAAAALLAERELRRRRRARHADGKDEEESGVRAVERRRWRGDSEEARAALVRSAEPRPPQRPFVLQGVPLGRCSSAWTDEYLEASVGDLKVSAHVSPTASLDFAGKNFSYEVMPMRDFLRRARRPEGDSDKYLYYRSQHAKRNKASTLEVLSPLDKDFSLPDAIAGDLAQVAPHSTVLRIASVGLRMWLHYDVCDNFLVCLRGRKRVVVIPPSRVGELYVEGSSSSLGSRALEPSSSDPDAELWREFPMARKAWESRYEVMLEEGDTLFIPAMWLHCTEACSASHGAPSSGELCISVNVFVKRLSTEALHDSKDVWANRELIPAQEAFKALDDKALPALKRLPAEHRGFYCKKAAASLLAMAREAEREHSAFRGAA